MFNLYLDDIIIIGTMCDIETAHRMPENWCKLLTKNDMPVLGYFNDLKNYWIRSHGNKLNSYATCFILQDWVTELDKFINNDVDRLVGGFFQEKILKFFTIIKEESFT
jgi:hypothetical protein